MTRVARALIAAGPLVVLAAALILPVAWVSAHGWSLTGPYEESLGYRYFYSLRVVYGGEYVFLPQGHLINIGYQWLHRLLTAGGFPPTQLVARIDVFAYAAVVSAHLTAVVCFAWAVRPLSTLAGVLFTLVFWLAVYYGMGEVGAYVLLQPDYHPWILSIGLLTEGVFSRWPEWLNRWSVRHSVALGILLGAAAAIKATGSDLSRVDRTGLDARAQASAAFARARRAKHCDWGSGLADNPIHREPGASASAAPKSYLVCGIDAAGRVVCGLGLDDGNGGPLACKVLGSAPTAAGWHRVSRT